MLDLLSVMGQLRICPFPERQPRAPKCRELAGGTRTGKSRQCLLTGGAMQSLLICALELLDRAEEAWKASDRLIDPDAKEVMLQLGRHYNGLARTAVAQARARECGFDLIQGPRPPTPAGVEREADRARLRKAFPGIDMTARNGRRPTSHARHR